MLDFKTLLEVDKWLQVYLLLNLFDFATGILKAVKTEGFKSRKMRDGIIRVIAELIAIIFAGILDYLLGLSILMVATKTGFIFKEAISIIENLGLLGVDMPNIVKDKLEDLKETKEEVR